MSVIVVERKGGRFWSQTDQCWKLAVILSRFFQGIISFYSFKRKPRGRLIILYIIKKFPTREVLGT